MIINKKPLANVNSSEFLRGYLAARRDVAAEMVVINEQTFNTLCALCLEYVLGNVCSSFFEICYFIIANAKHIQPGMRFLLIQNIENYNAPEMHKGILNELLQVLRRNNDSK